MTTLLIFLLQIAFAAPYPATSSSALIDTSKSAFFHGFGFRLKNSTAGWSPVTTVHETIFESLRFEPKLASANSEASLSIRMDRFDEKTGLETYAKKWMRDYPSYGFEVLGSKKIILGGGNALLVDLVQKNKNRQLRQVILQNGGKVAIVTCLDKKDRFSETLQTCNQILRGFEWVQ